MKKWLLLLVFALLLHAGCVRAEEQIYYTNKLDVYYHTDPDCDRPKTSERYEGSDAGPFPFYERACFQKYEIGEEAARAFDRAACPVCVKDYEPVYLGEHMPEWEYDAAPWIGAMESRIPPGFGTEEYRAEISDTRERFEAYYEEIPDRETFEVARLHPYPDAYAGTWWNLANGYSYAIVEPTQEILDAFRNMFGGGAWIVPAKYGYNEMYEMQEQIFDIIGGWCGEHPEFDIHANTAGIAPEGNYLGVGLYGEDWAEAMPVLDAELELPLWVYFFESAEVYAV